MRARQKQRERLETESNPVKDYKTSNHDLDQGYPQTDLLSQFALVKQAAATQILLERRWILQLDFAL